MADEQSGVEHVEFVCVRDGGRLRVRVTSAGYHPTANCQFPKALRVEGRRFRAPREALSFAAGPHGTFFYRVRKSAIQEIVDFDDVRVFDVDEENPECIICMSEPKSIVYIPCGHYCSCQECALEIQAGQGTCPICRARISTLVDHAQLE